MKAEPSKKLSEEKRGRKVWGCGVELLVAGDAILALVVCFFG